MATESEINALRARILDVLLSTSARSIDFTLCQYHIDWPIGFTSVYMAIVQVRIKIDVRKFSDPDVEAQYITGKNLLLLPSPDYGKTVDEKKSLIHECVHAMIDIQGRTGEGKTRLMGEAAAYVAGALFYIYESPTSWVSTHVDDPIFLTADEIAGSIVKKRDGANPQVTQTATAVSNADAGRLMVYIINDRVYKDRGITWVDPSLADGVPAIPGR